jgi:hypothetical protein
VRPETSSSRLRLLVLPVTLAALAGCPTPAPPDGGSDTGPTNDGGTGGGTDAGSSLAKSAKGNLRFKGPERLNADFATALELDAADVCKELGQYDCSTSVHPLALGGVDPYGKGLYEGQLTTGATTPIVVDRMALLACGERVARDLSDPSHAIIFKGVLGAGGTVADRNGPEVTAAITELYHRVLLREPEPQELAALKQLVGDIEATHTAEPGKQWLRAACFTVLSSAESVFY